MTSTPQQVDKLIGLAVILLIICFPVGVLVLFTAAARQKPSDSLAAARLKRWALLLTIGGILFLVGCMVAIGKSLS